MYQILPYTGKTYLHLCLLSPSLPLRTSRNASAQIVLTSISKHFNESFKLTRKIQNIINRRCQVISMPSDLEKDLS
ncbi:hypothetical protein EUGRSUZ_B01128 [Eucalyptus grandis]|uniref:Uncharacterized protein n=2 Tax=Eucalyptus grandis TaxID=71139 RepID=A0ACC3LPP6_EUCGR|nr:hypothetical protein EUGRSUZ_B01128 [Eucalyptus grandis]